MKTTLKFSVMLTLVLGTMVTKANEIKLNLVTLDSEKSLVFNLGKVTKDTDVQLLDSYNNIIYDHEVAKNTSLKQKFNFSQLEEGTYTLNVTDDIKVVSYMISIDNQSVAILDKKEMIKPAFRVKDNRVFINLMNIAKEEVQILVFDEFNRVLHSEIINGQIIVEKAINFTKAYKGTYNVVVKNKNGSHQKFITI